MIKYVAGVVLGASTSFQKPVRFTELAYVTGFGKTHQLHTKTNV